MKRTLAMLLASLLLLAPASCVAQPGGGEIDLPADFWSLVDGSTATIPISEALYAFFTGDEEGRRSAVNHSQTFASYGNLLDGKADVIFVTEPTPDLLSMFEEAGVEIEVIPIVREAFVLFINNRNPVTSLTVQQLQDIYKGKITNWKDVGGDDLAIMPYQRNEASGSQSLFTSLLMKGEPPAPVPSEYVFADMSSIIDATTSYEEWGLGGMGFSVFFYANIMYEYEERLHFLEVDGVAPNNGTIARGEYPLATYYYAVIRKDSPDGGPARKLVDFILTDEGQRLMQDIGYVPLEAID